jgi:hypothetical protein
MDGLDDIAPMMFYNMLITSLPADQRPARDDFGPSLRANEDIIRRMLKAIRDARRVDLARGMRSRTDDTRAKKSALAACKTHADALTLLLSLIQTTTTSALEPGGL